MILYEGRSAWNSLPIVVIATFGSDNRKTGPMVQTWILARDVAPTQVMQSPLLEAAICGTCRHRGGNGKPRTCYVVVSNAPQQVWHTYQRRGYEPVDWAKFDAQVAWNGLRIDSYGDPMAAPLEMWERAAERACVRTGYTHMWREAPYSERWQRLCMASVDSDAEQVEAASRGWTTYQVGPGTGVQCPENKTRITCQQCGLCDPRRRRNVWVEPIVGRGTGSSLSLSQGSSSPSSARSCSGSPSSSPTKLLEVGDG